MKEGLLFENGEAVYYKNGKPEHAGVIEIDGSIYYISSKGKAVKGQHIVHREMANGILKKGTYTFGDDYKLVKGSYIAPKKRKTKQKIQLSAKENEKLKKLLRTLRKNVRKIIPAALSVVCLVVLLVLISQSGGTGSITSSKEELRLPTFEEEVLLCSPNAKLVYDHQMDIADAIVYGTPYRPFVFQYQFRNASGILYLSENADMTDAAEYALPGEKTSIEIHNLKTGTTYYYKVRVNGEEHSGSFKTAQSNRFVYIPDTVNIRDIGGYPTMDGNMVKQGLLIRGIELDGLVNSAYYPSADAIKQMQDTFGFVHDMDLRYSDIFQGVYQSRLGADISHKFYHSPEYGQIFSPINFSTLRAIFQDLADPEKYPMYLHCTWGMDRTGTIVFLLQGILNVSEEDMILEYKQTSYVHQAIANSQNINIIISGLTTYEGDTLQEKIVSFLTTSVGVTEEEIHSIRTIFLENPPA